MGLQHSEYYLEKGCLEMNAKKEGGNGGVHTFK
jgi:hypothetical protein